MDNKKKEKKQEVNKTSDGFTPPPKVLTNDNIDINSKELGSFENVDTSGLEEFVEEAKKNDKKNIKIDFERFEKKKKQEKNNWINVKFDIWLSSKKAILFIWLIIIGTIIFLLTLQLPLMIVTDGIINNRNNVDNLPWVYPTYRSMQVFGYISLFLPTIPLFFLLTSWIVGTNGIIKSKKYILFFWFILCVSLLCMFLTIILSSTIISNHNSFWI